MAEPRNDQQDQQRGQPANQGQQQQPPPARGPKELRPSHRFTKRYRSRRDDDKLETQVELTVHFNNTIPRDEVVHVRFLVDDVEVGKGSQLLGDDGWCEEILVVNPGSRVHVKAKITWKGHPDQDTDLGDLQVPHDPREGNPLEGFAIRLSEWLDKNVFHRSGRPKRRGRSGYSNWEKTTTTTTTNKGEQRWG